jgi:hypothetical protein
MVANIVDLREASEDMMLLLLLLLLAPEVLAVLVSKEDIRKLLSEPLLLVRVRTVAGILWASMPAVQQCQIS